MINHDALGNAGSAARSSGPQRIGMLVIDEQPVAREAMARRFSHLRYDVQLADNGMTAITMLPAHRFHIVLVDTGLTILTADDTIRRMRNCGMLGGASIVSIAPHGDDRAALQALEAGADEHISKPFDFDVVDLRIRHLVARAQEIADLSRHNAALDARVARRAIELGETRAELDELREDRARLVSSIRSLHDEIERLSAGHQ